jgi:hypothetical protein
METEKLFVSVCIPQEIRDNLQQYQDGHEIKSTSMAVEAILREYFQTDDELECVPLWQFKLLEEKVRGLSRQVETLIAAAPSLAPIGTEASTEEHGNVPQPTIASTYEEIEDEPCEVLTAFLSPAPVDKEIKDKPLTD